MNPGNLIDIDLDLANGLEKDLNKTHNGFKYSRSDLLAARENVFHRKEFRKLSWKTQAIINELGIKKRRKRGTRGGSKNSAQGSPDMRNITVIDTTGKKVHETSDNLRLCVLNPWSVRNKADEINDFILDQGLDLLAVTETWLSGDITDNPIISALLPAGFSILQNPRQSRGGGTAVIYRDSVQVQQCSNIVAYESFELLECTFISTVLVRLCIIYRAPALPITSFLTDFADYMSNVLTSAGIPLIVGDFNIHVGGGANAVAFESLCNSFGLKQHVSGPTHRSGNTLDLVLTRSDDSLVQSVVSCDVGFPDHFPVFASLLLEKPKLPTVQVTYRKTKSITASALSEAIHKSAIPSCDIHGLFADELLSVYNSQLRNILNDLAPVKTRRVPVRPEAEWYSQGLREAKQIRRQAERAWRKSGLEVHRQVYMEKRNDVNSLIKESKVKFYKDMIDNSKNDTKQLFMVVNKLLGKKVKSAFPSGSDSSVADMFSNYYFDKVNAIRASIQTGDIFDYESPQTTCVTFLNDFQPVSQQIVDKIVRGSACKSCDLDPMPSHLVKMALPQLLPIITAIINKSLSTGTFPSDFKKALVTPLLKKPTLDPEVAKNFRPVSNLSFISKVLEKVVAQQLNEHLLLNNLQDTYQSAYRAGHSTETALLRIKNDIVKAVGERKVVLLTMIDLSAAFDTVNHERLLSTLNEFGVRDSALEWFQSYLTGRQQKVNIKGTHSDSKELTCGVPQGSVLGPILFTVYTASLGRLFRQEHLRYHIYADDTTFYLSIDPENLPDGIDQIERCMALIQQWMRKFHLKMNEDKTEFMIISSERLTNRFTPSSLTIGETFIEPSTSVRNLGVTLDHHITMDAYIQNLCRVAYFQLKNIGAVRKYLDRESLECVIHAFLTSKLDYCNSLLCGLPASLIDRLQLIQNTAARILTGTPRFDHITPVLQSLHWLPVQQRIMYKILLLVFKSVHHLAPSYLRELICPYIPSRKLRSSDQHLLKVPYAKSAFVQTRTFSVAGPRLWNSLPYDLRTVQCFERFKSKLKTHLFREAFD